MKKILILFCFLAFQERSFSQQMTFPFIIEPPLQPISKYQENLKLIKDKENILDFNYWEDKTLTKENKEKKKFSDFTKTEKILYILMKSEALTISASALDESWISDSKRATERLIENKPGGLYYFPINGPATKSEINGVLLELYVFRKSFAKKYEKFAESLYETEIDKKEIDFKIQKIKKYHTENKLTDK